MKAHNLVGPQVRRQRFLRGWSQAQLATKLQLKGFDISREVVAQIEGQVHCVKDRDLPYLAAVFQIEIPALFPEFPKNASLHDTMRRLLRDEDLETPKIVMKSLQAAAANVVNRSQQYERNGTSPASADNGRGKAGILDSGVGGDAGNQLLQRLSSDPTRET